MKTYFFIPISFDNQLSVIIGNWLQNPDSFVILTGVYKETQDEIIEDYTLTETRNNIFEIVKFKQGYISEDNVKMKIIGFCLEGSLEIVAPDLLEEINKHSDILQFETNIDYLNWINNY